MRPQRDTNMVSPYKAVKCFPNISQMKYHTDLILGEAFCIRQDSSICHMLRFLY